MIFVATTFLRRSRTFYVEEICQGVIEEGPSGKDGFKYDPIFDNPEYERTMVEISLINKNKIKHRSKDIELFKKEVLFFMIKK